MSVSACQQQPLLLLPLLLLLLTAGHPVSPERHNVSYSVPEETDGPLLVGDLAGDLRLDAKMSQDALARRSVAFLLHSPDFRSHFRVRRVTPQAAEEETAEAGGGGGSGGGSGGSGGGGSGSGRIRYELLLVRRLDRESVCPDSGDGALAASPDCHLVLSCVVEPFEDPMLVFTVRISVLDVNDHSPVFDPPWHELQFSEADPAGTRRAIPHAADADSGRNARIAYDLEPAAHDAPFYESLFRIDSDSQTQVYLALAAPLDRERCAVYNLTVAARDFGNVRRTGYLRLTVLVQDANDCFPEFERHTYEVAVVENSPSKDLIQVRAVDRDEGANGRVRYQLSADTPAAVRRYLSIDADTGLVRLDRPLDREATPELRAQLRGVDCGHPAKTGAAGLHVTILDINDNAPTVELTGGGSGSGGGGDHGGGSAGAITTAAVAENRPPQTVVASFTARDPDLGINGSVRCRLADPQQQKPQQQQQPQLFEVREFDSRLGIYQILTRERLDRELSSAHRLVVACADGGGLETLLPLLVTVEDDNDNPPILAETQLFAQVPENCPPGRLLANVTATDADVGNNGRITYSLLSDSEGESAFTVDAVTGAVRTAGSLDRESRASVTLRVVAEDAGQPLAFSATATVFVEVVDVNDVPPVLPRRLDFSVEENEPPGIELGPVRWSDPDSGNGGRVTFFGGDRGAFQVTESGMIVTQRSFDREQRAGYAFPLFARDHGRPSLTSTATVNVQILDKNDWPPRFLFPFAGVNYSVSMHETAGHLVLQAAAKDPDEGENGRVEYRLLVLDPALDSQSSAAASASAAALFELDPHSGRLRLGREATVGDLGWHRLRLSAADCGAPRRLNSSVDIGIQVLDTPPKEPPPPPAAPSSSGVGGVSGVGTAVLGLLVGLTASLLLLSAAAFAFLMLRRRRRRRRRSTGVDWGLRRQQGAAAASAETSAGGKFGRQRGQSHSAGAGLLERPLMMMRRTATGGAPMAAGDAGAATDGEPPGSPTGKTLAGDNVYCSSPYIC